MRSCAVCGGVAGQRCGGCGNVSYCGQSHQKKHWPQHRPTCGPVKVVQSIELGKYFVAARDLVPGDLILDEEVSLLAPSLQAGPQSPVCLGCYFPSHGHQCPKCGCPLCGPRCSTSPSSHHSRRECEVLARGEVGGKINRDLSWVMGPLRLLLLKQADVARFKRCTTLSTNLSIRRDQDDFKETENKTTLFLELFPELGTTYEEVLDILCILDTNTFQVLASGCGENLAGLYPRAALLNHSCVPNCRLVFRADYSLQVIASTSIKKGETTFISYTPPFFSLLTRRSILQRGKQFLCLCPRCSDPTELGTFLSSPRCSNCQDGFLQAVSPSSPSSPWQCSSCSSCITLAQFMKLDSDLLNIQTNMDREDVRGMKGVLEQQGQLIHPNHALLTETKQHLAAALGRVEGFRYDQLSQEDLQLKVRISEELLTLLSVLEPGISKSRGITLLDMTEARVRLVLGKESGDRGKVLEQLQQVETQLEEAHSILCYEDETALEGNVARQAREQLNQLRAHIGVLKSRKT